MRELDKNYVYSLEDLTSEEFKVLNKYLTNDKEARWTSVTFTALKNKSLYNLYWDKDSGWCLDSFTNTQTINAKELFYTLENVQVDCTELTKEQVKEMADIFEKAGYESYHYSLETNLQVKNQYTFIKEHCEDYTVGVRVPDKTTITYEKFMELFAPKYEVKYIAESPKPQHYAKGIDTFSRMEANCTKEECLAFAKGNIDKYNWREKGQDLEDFKKIIAYANWAIKLLEK